MKKNDRERRLKIIRETYLRLTAELMAAAHLEHVATGRDVCDELAYAIVESLAEVMEMMRLRDVDRAKFTKALQRGIKTAWNPEPLNEPTEAELVARSESILTRLRKPS